MILERGTIVLGHEQQYLVSLDGREIREDRLGPEVTQEGMGEKQRQEIRKGGAQKKNSQAFSHSR